LLEAAEAMTDEVLADYPTGQHAIQTSLVLDGVVSCHPKYQYRQLRAEKWKSIGLL